LTRSGFQEAAAKASSGASDSPAPLANIQVLRCFAAMGVVFHHLQARFSATLDTPFVGYFGIAGVDVFFVISGFIMFHATRSGTRTATGFWLDRAIRIAPLYWIATLMVIGLMQVGVSADGATAISVGDFIASLAFFPEVRADGMPFPALDVGWTLVYEAWFYLLFGLTFFLKSQARALAVLTLVFVVCAALRLTVSNLPFALGYYFQPITLEFAAGGGLALLWRSHAVQSLSSNVARTWGWLLLVVGTVSLLAMGWREGWRLNTEFELRLLVLGLPAAMIVAGVLLLEKAGRVWTSPVLLLLGAASYSIYLFHQFVVTLMLGVGQAMSPDLGALAHAGLLAAGLGLAAIVGVGVHVALEKPLTAALKRLARRRASLA
jgi:exopolysaccharide production protein ExoZ